MFWSKSDSDGDGLLDGEEIEIRFREIDGEIALDRVETDGRFRIRDLAWFALQVDNDAKWDIKREPQWIDQLPGIKFLTLKGKFVLRKEVADAEAFGNIHYGYIGAAIGYEVKTLHLGASWASFWANPRGGFSDDAHDSPNIDLGISYFNDDRGLMSQ